MKRVLLPLFVLVGFGAVAAGDEPPLITDRPDQSDTPFVLPRGLFQIEGGGTYGERHLAGEELQATAFPSALLRFGVTDTFELRLGVPGIAIESTDSAAGNTRSDGLVDATFGFKLAIVEQKGAVPHAAFVGTLLVPSGNDEFSSDRVDPAFRFAFSNVLSDHVALTYNVGMLWLSGLEAGQNRDTRSFFDWTFTAGFVVTPKLGAFAELFGLAGVSAVDRPRNSTGGGVVYLVTPRLQVDGRVTVGLSSMALDWTVGVGVSYRFPRFTG